MKPCSFTHRVLSLVVLLAATAIPHTAPAQVVTTALAALSPSARGELTALLDSASTAQLPLAPLHAKIVEGVAKHADPARIVVVVRDIAAGLRTARAQVGPEMTDDELVAAGAALQAGATPPQLRDLRRAVPASRSATQAFVVLTDLVRRGGPAADGAVALGRLARAGVGDNLLAQLRAEIAQDVAAGVAPTAAVMRRTDAFVAARREAARPVTPSALPFDPEP